MSTLRPEIDRVCSLIDAGDPSAHSEARKLYWDFVHEADSIAREYSMHETWALGATYPSRKLVEYALATQTGLILDMRLAREEFFAESDAKLKRLYEEKRSPSV